MPNTRVLFSDNLKLAGASGNIGLVDPRLVPPGTPPPGGPFPPPAPIIGAKPFALFQIPVQGLGPFNSTLVRPVPNNAVSLLNTGQANRMRLFVLPGGPKSVWNPTGRVNLDAYHANVNALAANVTINNKILACLADGTIFAFYLFDEPHLVSRYGRVITDTEIKAVATLVQSKWPGSRMFIRSSASRASMRIHPGLGFFLSYSARMGNLETILAREIAAAQRFDNAELIVQMNVIDFYGSARPGSADTPPTPSDLLTYGTRLATHSYAGIVGMAFWEYQTEHYSPLASTFVTLAQRFHAAHP